MSDKPYLLISDVHLHAWTAFATVDGSGVNTRLLLTLEAIEEAARALQVAGGHEILIAGDLFHVRGKLSPSVLNPTLDCFCALLESGFYVGVIPGNHDLENKNSDRVGNAVMALEGIGVEVVNETTVLKLETKPRVAMVPWQPTIAALHGELDSLRGDADDVIIHAPLDGVLPQIPASGLTATKLMKYGFNRVFVGHYHNHVNFDDRVYSIGALTHQTWADVGTKAGFLLVYPDEVAHQETSAPKFIDVDTNSPILDSIAGNYLRVRGEFASAREVDQTRESLLGFDAFGVTVHPVKKEPAIARTSEMVTAGMSVEQSIAEYIKSRDFPNVRELAVACQEVLNEARSIEA